MSLDNEEQNFSVKVEKENITKFSAKNIKEQLSSKLGSLKDAKSRTLLKNVFVSFFMKGINILVNFLTIPLVLSFLDNTQYGIWLTLTTILSWFSLFDLGFGNGLRNHLTIAITKQDFKEGKIFVSTTYLILSAIFGGLIVLFLAVHSFIDWTAVFNAPSYMEQDLKLSLLFAICLLFVQFVAKLISIIFISYQKAALADIAGAIIQVCILVGLYLLKITHQNSLTSVALVFSATPVVIFVALSFYFFNERFSAISPSFTSFRKNYIDKLLKISIDFFIIQVAALVLYATDNFIIAQLYSPADVTTYNISFKYFSIVSVIFSIIVTPFWSMVTKSHTQGDIAWIKKGVKNLLFLWLLVALGSLVQLYFSDTFYKVWTNDKVAVPFALSAVIYIYTITTTYSSIFGSFLNGVGKIRLQLYTAVISMILNIPLAIFLAKYCGLGIIGIPLSTTITAIISNVFISIQYKKIVDLKAKGIWDR